MGPGTSEEAVSADYYEFKADAAAKVVTAKALLGVVGSFKFMLALTIFRDILTQLNLVSKAFQKAHVYYNDAREILASVKAGLTAQYLTPDFVGGEDDELHVQQGPGPDAQPEGRAMGSRGRRKIRPVHHGRPGDALPGRRQIVGPLLNWLRLGRAFPVT